MVVATRWKHFLEYKLDQPNLGLLYHQIQSKVALCHPSSSDSEVVISDLAFVLVLILASWLDRSLCGTFSGLDSYFSEAGVGCLGLAYAILIQVERLQTQNEILRTVSTSCYHF
jgi:hypothetical protein